MYFRLAWERLPGAGPGFQTLGGAAVIRRMEFRGSLAAAALGLGLVLGGCAHAEAPINAAPEGTRAATAEESPAYKPASPSGPAQNVRVPVLPVSATTETQEGMETFVRYWFATLDYAYQTGNTGPVEAVSGPDCSFCNGLIENIRTAWMGDRWISGGRIMTPAVTAIAVPGEPWLATVQVIQGTVKLHRPDGTLFQEPTKATNSGSRALASFGTDGWTLIELGLIR